MNSKLLLIVSLAVNGVLGIAYLRKESQAPAPSHDSPQALSSASNEKPVPTRQPLFTRGQATFDWQRVESADYRQYIENLRAVGCPEETIRDIIVADVNKLFESRKQEMAKTNDTFQFWKAGPGLFAPPDPAKYQEELKWRTELAQEKRALLKDLLGVDIPQKPDAVFAPSNPLESMLGFLPAAKRDQLLELEQKYAALRSAPGGASPPGDISHAKRLQAEKEAELARILSAQEIEEYQLRMSPVAMNMRAQLDAFQPTEQEFREIFRLKKKFEDEHGGNSNFTPVDPASAEKRTAALQELDAEIRKVVGDDRYAEYERAQDWAYKGALQIVQQHGLPKETAVQVYELKKLAEDQAREFRTDQSLTVPEQLQAMAAIRAEAERALAETLGADGFETYRKQIGGSWLRNLAPNPAPSGLDFRPTPTQP